MVWFNEKWQQLKCSTGPWCVQQYTHSKRWLRQIFNDLRNIHGMLLKLVENAMLFMQDNYLMT